MEGTVYLFSAFGITWIALFLYIYSMLKRQKSLERQVEKISEFLDKNQAM
jgi:CcmD family protein